MSALEHINSWRILCDHIDLCFSHPVSKYRHTNTQNACSNSHNTIAKVWIRISMTLRQACTYANGDRYAHDRKYTTNKTINIEQDEVFEIADANAIIDPRTVMIHLVDASVAHATMMSTRRFHAHTNFTILFEIVHDCCYCTWGISFQRLLASLVFFWRVLFIVHHDFYLLWLMNLILIICSLCANLL